MTVVPQPASSGHLNRDALGAGYLPCDLLAYREALALRLDDLAGLLGIDAGKQQRRERGIRDAGMHLAGEVLAMEAFVDAVAAQEIAAITAAAGPGRDDAVVLEVTADPAEFPTLYPAAVTRQDKAPYPASLEHVAIGRAAAELLRRGYAVEVYRGDRRADLMVLRAAAGMFKNETVNLLQVHKGHYYRWELDRRPPPVAALAELRAINDFIAATAADLNILPAGDTGVLLTYSDAEQQRFEADYPHARTLTGAAAYPARLHRIAAAHRARIEAAAGGQVRIAQPKQIADPQ